MSDSTTASADRTAWSDFWANNAGSTAGGCLPTRSAEMEAAQRAMWAAFVADLPKDATVLDLATGDGRVLGWMRAERDDLTLLGIDFAPDLPDAPEGTETRGGIAMEKLPLDADTQVAVVSQFGFEYGDVAAVAEEIARVLRPTGKVGLMIHRGDGPILKHNLARSASIDWAIAEKSVGDVARNALMAPNGGPDAAAQVCAAFAMLGANKFGQETPAWEIPEAMRRAIVMGQKEGKDGILQVITAIEAQAANETGRIASLQRACATADDRKSIVEAFSRHGLILRSTQPVLEPSGRELADFLTFTA